MSMSEIELARVFSRLFEQDGIHIKLYRPFQQAGNQQKVCHVYIESDPKSDPRPACPVNLAIGSASEQNTTLAIVLAMASCLADATRALRYYEQEEAEKEKDAT